MIEIVISDGGRVKEGFAYEKNDCTVRALAHCEDIPYITARNLLQDLRIRPTRRIAQIVLEKFLFDRGYRKMPIIKKTLAGFCQFYKGNYYVLVRGHAVCVKGGKVYDTFQDRPGKRIKAVYEVI